MGGVQSPPRSAVKMGGGAIPLDPPSKWEGCNPPRSAVKMGGVQSPLDPPSKWEGCNPPRSAVKMGGVQSPLDPPSKWEGCNPPRFTGHQWTGTFGDIIEQDKVKDKLSFEKGFGCELCSTSMPGKMIIWCQFYLEILWKNVRYVN